MDPEAERRAYWRCAVLLSTLVGAASLLGLANAPNAEHPIAAIRIFGAFWATAILGVLVARRNNPSLRVSKAAFALVPLPLFPTFWLILGERALHDLPFEAFIRQELVCIVYALATPTSPALSLGVIAAFTADALMLLWWLGPHAHLVAAQSWQPWTILLYGACAAAIALFQARGQRRAVAMITAMEREAAMKRLVMAHLAARDLVNTPLQTLRISLSLMADRCPDARDLQLTMERSVERLDQLNHLLRTDVPGVEWTPGDESFDPIQVLEANLQGAK
jgi:hypothetical protein